MEINADNIVSITEANQNFSKVMRMAEKNGPIVIMRNNHPVGRIIADVNADEIRPKKATSHKNKRISKDELAHFEQRAFGRFMDAFRELAGK